MEYCASKHQRHVVDVKCAINYEAYGPCTGEHMYVAYVPQRSTGMFAFVCEGHLATFQMVWKMDLVAFKRVKEVK